jgi:hypothetical protein
MANLTVLGDLSCSQSAKLRVESSSGEDSDAGSVVLGILLGLFASIGINLGQNLQKSGQEDVTKAWLAFPGTVLFIGSAIVNFVAFAFAPASVLAPLEGAQFVTNFAYGLVTRNKVLYEPPAKKGDRGHYKCKAVSFTLVGTLLVVAGIILPILEASNEVAKFDVDALWCFWRGRRWWIYFLSTLAVGTTCVVLYRFLRRGFNPTVRTDTLESKVKQFGCCGPLKNQTRTYIDKKENYNRNNSLHMVLYAMPSAIVGAFSVVQAKAISELVELFLNGDYSILGEWLFYQCVLLIAVGLVPWFLVLNRATLWFEVLAILPLMQGFYIIFSSLGGGIFFEEFNSFTSKQAWYFGIGLSLIVVGLWFILPEALDDPSPGQNGEYDKALLPSSEKARVEEDANSSYEVVVGAFGMPIALYPRGPASSVRFRGGAHAYAPVQTEAALPAIYLQ